MDEREAIVAVLAGGAGSRLGGVKPAAELAGRPLISYPLESAREAGLEAVVVAKPETRLPDLDADVLLESDPLVHPLTGVLAALEANPGRAVVALACDLPFVPAALLAELGRGADSAAADAGDAAIEVGGRLEPLLARYGPKAAPAIRTALCRGEGASELLARLGPRIIAGSELRSFGDPQRIAFNVNTPEQLAEAERFVARVS